MCFRILYMWDANPFPNFLSNSCQTLRQSRCQTFLHVDESDVKYTGPIPNLAVSIAKAKLAISSGPTPKPFPVRTNGFRTQSTSDLIFLQTYTMSFDGIVAEFPFLGVDRFNTDACVFLLTHCHQDHLVGLLNRSFSGLVYCTPQTRLLLASLTNNASVLARIKPVAYNTPLQLELRPEIQNIYGNVTITLVHAYHCLGACMFLIEGELGGSVLCTGDLRAEKWWIDSLDSLPQLAPYLEGFKTLDNIYLDTTFGYRGEPYIEMPPNNRGIYTAIGLLKNYPMDDPEICFRFRNTVLGFDQAWAFIVSYFGASLEVVDDKLRDVIDLVAKHDLVNGPSLSHARGKCTRQSAGSVLPRFLAGKGELPQITIHIAQCIDFNIMDLAGLFYPLHLEALSETERESTMDPIRITAMGNSVIKLRDRLWILSKNGQYLLPIEIKLIFSRHSSYSECVHLLSRLRPRQVFPCWSSHTAWANGFSMSRLFGKYCTGKTFAYDIDMAKKFGSITKAHLERPVATIDRWNTSECESEKDFVEQYLEARVNAGTKGALINIRRVAKISVFSKKRIFQIEGQNEGIPHKSLKRALTLDDLSSGQAKSIRAFIEAQQQLYYRKHNLPQYERDFEHPMYHNAFGSGIKGTSEVDSQSSDSSLDLEKMGIRKYSYGSDISSSGMEETLDTHSNRIEQKTVSPCLTSPLAPSSPASVSEWEASSSESLDEPHITNRKGPTTTEGVRNQTDVSEELFTFEQKRDSELLEWMFSSCVPSAPNCVEDSIPIHKKRLVDKGKTLSHWMIS